MSTIKKNLKTPIQRFLGCPVDILAFINSSNLSAKKELLTELHRRILAGTKTEGKGIFKEYFK